MQVIDPPDPTEGVMQVQPAGCVSETKVMPAGMTSVKVLVGVEVVPEKLLTLTSKPTSDPAAAVGLSALFTTDRSASWAATVEVKANIKTITKSGSAPLRRLKT